MALKVITVCVAVIALAMLVLTMVGHRFMRPPKVALLCIPDMSVVEKVDKALAARELQRDVDYRVEAFHCDSPNTPRQAVVMAVGSEAVVFVNFDQRAESELTAAHRSAVFVDPTKFSAAMDTLANEIRIKQAATH